MSFSPNDTWLFSFLQRIRQRPLMYLWNENVRTLENYLRGYTQARLDLGVPEFVGDEEGVLDDFEKWLATWLATKMNSKRNVGWAGHVELLDPSERSIHTFFREFDEFLGSRGIVLTKEMAARWPAHIATFKDWSPPDC